MNLHSPKSYAKLPANKAFSIDPYIAASLIELLCHFALHPEKMTAWECCAGRGDLMEDLQHYGMQIYGSDINDHPGRITRLPIRTGIDAFDQTFVPDEVDLVVTNPPFDNPLCERLIAHLLKIAPKQWHAYFLPYSWPAAKSDFRDENILGGGRWHAYATLGRRVDLVEPDADGFQDGSGMVDHTWLLFRPTDMPFADARIVRLEPQVKHTRIRPGKRKKRERKAGEKTMSEGPLEPGAMGRLAILISEVRALKAGAAALSAGADRIAAELVELAGDDFGFPERDVGALQHAAEGGCQGRADARRGG